jgi:hypothetical protein
MSWAASELEHVGRIAATEDPDIQYSYALSTVNGMAHLKDAIFQLVNNPDYDNHKTDLLVYHGKVIRTMKHLIRTYGVDLDTIRAFNTRHVLSDLDYLEDGDRNMEGGNPMMMPMMGGFGMMYRKKSKRNHNRKNRKHTRKH